MTPIDMNPVDELLAAESDRDKRAREPVPAQGQDRLRGHGRAGRGQGERCVPDRGAPRINS